MYYVLIHIYIYDVSMRHCPFLHQREAQHNTAMSCCHDLVSESSKCWEVMFLGLQQAVALVHRCIARAHIFGNKQWGSAWQRDHPVIRGFTLASKWFSNCKMLTWGSIEFRGHERAHMRKRQKSTRTSTRTWSRKIWQSVIISIHFHTACNVTLACTDNIHQNPISIDIP